jgi:hypothetical protein
MTDKSNSTRSRATKASAQFRAFRPRVSMAPLGRNRWQIALDGAPTDLIVTCLGEHRWAVNRTSGEIIARDCRSAAKGEDVAAHFLCGSFL